VDVEQLRIVVEDLIKIVQLQAKETEKLSTHVAKVTTHLSRESQMHLVVSELSEILNRVRKLKSG
jgi:polyhydroxyalkanoate synthesis regulator phasin